MIFEGQNFNRKLMKIDYMYIVVNIFAIHLHNIK